MKGYQGPPQHSGATRTDDCDAQLLMPAGRARRVVRRTLRTAADVAGGSKSHQTQLHPWRVRLAFRRPHIAVEIHATRLPEVRHRVRRRVPCGDDAAAATGRDAPDLVTIGEVAAPAPVAAFTTATECMPALSMSSSSHSSPTPCATPYDRASLPTTTITRISYAAFDELIVESARLDGARFGVFRGVIPRSARREIQRVIMSLARGSAKTGRGNCNCSTASITDCTDEAELPQRLSYPCHPRHP